MLNPRERRRFTPEEYLAVEERSETKSEYCDGEIYVMSGGTLRHNLLMSNFIGELRSALRGSECKVLPSDMRLYVQRSKLFTYPDVTVICGPPVLLPNRDDTLCDARVVIEILSASTEAYDRGDKFRMYQKLPSLAEYVLVPQDTQAIESYHRRGKKWVRDDGALFSSLGISLAVEALYDGL